MPQTSNQTILKALFLVAAVLFVSFVFGQTKSPNGASNLQNSSARSVALDMRKYCQDNSNDFGNKETCYSVKFTELAEKNGADFSFEVLYSLQNIDPDTKGCHLLAHGIGIGAYNKNPESWKTLISTLPTSCSYGAIHGVLGEHINNLPEKSLTEEIIPTFCGEKPKADCNHIIGHLILVETDADVPKALKLCGVFKDKVQEEFCFTGVFMEYQTALNLIEHGLVDKSWKNWPLRIGEMENMCRSFSGLAGESCWEEMAHTAAATFNNDPKQVFDFCSKSQLKEGSKKCKRHSIGIMAASENFDLSKLGYMCAIPQADNPNFENECYGNLVASALSSSPNSIRESVDFCNGLEPSFRQNCFSTIGNVYKGGVLNKELLDKSCKMARTEFRNLCLGEFASGSVYIPRSND